MESKKPAWVSCVCASGEDKSGVAVWVGGGVLLFSSADTVFELTSFCVALSSVLVVVSGVLALEVVTLLCLVLSLEVLLE